MFGERHKNKSKLIRAIKKLITSHLNNRTC